LARALQRVWWSRSPKIIGSDWATRPNAKKKEIQPNPTSNEKQFIITKLLYYIKKSHQFIFFLLYEKK
jgi:hypothetical protein